ncbi:MAG: hypothetical protein IJT30_03785 [Muribaculaceae bacterium]|nr:hypothetical protein [Muribaculaceae bacterium]
MARKPRAKSRIGLYYATLRGMGTSRLFGDETDYGRFVELLRPLTRPGDGSEPPLALYAYCLTPCQVHLLTGERSVPLGQGIGRLASAYTHFFNKRYNHVGPLYHGRFRSEPVNDADYFVTLLRYIHKIPVEMGLANELADYAWSSWHEYTAPMADADRLCTHIMPFDDVDWESMCRLMRLLPRFDTERLASDLHRYERGGLIAALEAALPPDVSLGEVKGLQRDVRARFVLKALDCGAGLRQLARLTGMDYSTIARIKQRTATKR